MKGLLPCGDSDFTVAMPPCHRPAPRCRVPPSVVASTRRPPWRRALPSPSLLPPLLLPSLCSRRTVRARARTAVHRRRLGAPRADRRGAKGEPRSPLLCDPSNRSGVVQINRAVRVFPRHRPKPSLAADTLSFSCGLRELRQACRRLHLEALYPCPE